MTFPPVLRPTLHSDNSHYCVLSWRDYHAGFEDVSSDDSVLLHIIFDTVGQPGTRWSLVRRWRWD